MLSINNITNQLFDSRTYILTKKNCKKVWLVDCGDVDRVLEIIGEKSVEGVLLTHAHSDHIYGIEKLIKQFPEVKAYTNAAGVNALKDPRLNISHYHSEYSDIIIEAPHNLCVLKEGDALEVFGIPVQVYETPGHAPSCMTYIMEGKAFTGDAYIPGLKVFTGFPHSNRKRATESVGRILQLTSQCLIFPGHTVPEEMVKTNYCL